MTRCWFCFMQTSLRWLGIPLCTICRDQLWDFIWVSAVQTIVWAIEDRRNKSAVGESGRISELKCVELFEGIVPGFAVMQQNLN